MAQISQGLLTELTAYRDQMRANAIYHTNLADTNRAEAERYTAYADDFTALLDTATTTPGN